MRYLWTEDTGAGLHFWKLVNQLFFDNELVVESKWSNQGLLDAVIDLSIKDDDEYYKYKITFNLSAYDSWREVAASFLKLAFTLTMAIGTYKKFKGEL